MVGCRVVFRVGGGGGGGGRHLIGSFLEGKSPPHKQAKLNTSKQRLRD